MAEHPDVQRDNETNTISLDGRLLSDADLYAVAATPDVTRVKIFGLQHNLVPLAPLASLRQLDLTDPHTLDGLERFEQLETLTLYAFPRITSLDAVGKLHNLKKLMMSTLAEGHCLEPVFEATWAGACPSCGTARVVLSAPPPRSPRTACPVCDRARIERHVAAWNRAQAARPEAPEH